MEQRDLLSNDLLINEISQGNLVTSAKWGKFLAIVGFIFCALMLISGIVAQTVMQNFGSLETSAFLPYLGIFYVILAIILFFPCLYLNKFSNKILEAIRTPSQESLDTAFANLKSMFKFYGILSIVVLCFYALAFLSFGIGSLVMK